MDVSLEAEPSTQRSQKPQNNDQVGVHEVENPQAWYSVRIDLDAITAHDPLIGSWGFGQKPTRLQSSRDTR
jgi:hypothetical protein